MSLTIDLQPDMERGLLAQAKAKGLSLFDYAREILSREAASSELPTPLNGTATQAQNLYALLAPVRGLLTDDEVDLYFSRTPSSSRPVEFE
jgi:hypothetical protein